MNPVGYVADAGRLEALDGYGILDTSAEAAFDGLVRMASEACAAPVAMITLVAADRQWFKAHVGFDEPETPWIGRSAFTRWPRRRCSSSRT
jgi:hypothetical protein